MPEIITQKIGVSFTKMEIRLLMGLKELDLDEDMVWPPIVEWLEEEFEKGFFEEFGFEFEVWQIDEISGDAEGVFINFC
jgi:hypothetical protein